MCKAWSEVCFRLEEWFRPSTLLFTVVSLVPFNCWACEQHSVGPALGSPNSKWNLPLLTRWTRDSMKESRDFGINPLSQVDPCLTSSLTSFSLSKLSNYHRIALCVCCHWLEFSNLSICNKRARVNYPSPSQTWSSWGKPGWSHVERSKRATMDRGRFRGITWCRWNVLVS